MRSRWTRAAGAALLGAVPALLAVGALAPEAVKRSLAEGGIACVFRAGTDLPCPFCGMTRATLSLGGGDLGAALAYHPAAPLVLLLTMWAALGLARGRLQLFGRRIGAPALLAVVGGLWALKLIAYAVA